MSLSPARAFLTDACRAVSAENGAALGALLASTEASYPGLPAACAASAATGSLPALIYAGWSATADRRWLPVLTSHALALAALGGAAAGGDPAAADAACVLAFAHALGALEGAVGIVKDSSTNWALAPLAALCNRCRVLCARGRRALLARGDVDGGEGLCERLTIVLRGGFSATFNHRLSRDALPASKKWGSLGFVNAMLGQYFQAQALSQCKPLIKSIEEQVPKLDEFPLDQVVTFRYYAGRLAAYDEAWPAAEAALGFALRHCPAAASGNRRRIVSALLPVRLTLGLLPSAALLDAHGLGAYGPLVEALRGGDVGGFGAALEARKEWFIREGAYLVLEGLKLHVVRTLCKRVCVGRAGGGARVPRGRAPGPSPPPLPARWCSARASRSPRCRPHSP